MNNPLSGFGKFHRPKQVSGIENMNNMSLERKPIVRLVSFGDGERGIEKALARLRRQANEFPWIDEVKTYSGEDLSIDYIVTLGEFVKENPKGFGLWSWKPFLIQEEFKSMKDGDVLIYLDAGVEINKLGAPRFTFYLDHLAREDILVFSLDHQHRQWTKNNHAIFDYGQNYFRNQVVAGILMFRVSNLSRNLVESWKELCVRANGELLKDPRAQSPEFHDDLIEHRHDQSLLSRSVFELKVPTIPDETIFTSWRRGREYPFLALRNKSSSSSWLWWAFRTPFIVWRIVYVLKNPRILKKSISNLLKFNKR